MVRLVVYQFVVLKANEAWCIAAASYFELSSGVNAIEDKALNDNEPIRACRQKQIHIETASPAARPDCHLIAHFCLQGKRRAPGSAGGERLPGHGLVESFGIYPRSHLDDLICPGT